MASSSKKKPVGRMLIMGACSCVLYYALMTNQGLINSTFGKGGMTYALLPIVTAFIFSYFHGAFTGDFWTVLGIEAAKKKGGK